MSNETSNDILDSFDLTDVSTDFPVYAPGTYAVRIEAIERKLTKKGGEQLVLKLSIEQDVVTHPTETSKGGVSLPAGQVLYHRINLYPKGHEYVEFMLKGLKQIKEGFHPEVTAGPFGNLDSYLGAVALARVDVEEAKDNFPTSNRVKKFIAAK
jgi:hypothetical protein